MKENEIKGEVQYMNLPVSETYEAIASFLSKFDKRSFDLGELGKFSIGVPNFDRENNVISMSFTLENENFKKEVKMDYIFKVEDDNRSSFYVSLDMSDLEFLDSIDFNIDEVKEVEQM
jgi:hypothetical protein